MNWYKDYRLVQSGDEQIVEIYLNPEDAEFSSEFFTNIKENVLELDEQIKNLLEDNFSNIKINKVKLFVGAILIGTIPFFPYTKAMGAEITPSTTTTTTSSAVIAPSPTMTITPLNTTGTVTCDVLNVRSGPGTTSSILSKLVKGSTVTAIGSSNGWYQLQLSNGATGWVSMAYLSIAPPTIATTPLNTTGTVTCDVLNMRSGPGTSSSILSKLVKGSTVTAIGSSNGWYQIKLSDGNTGWVSMAFLNLVPPTIAQQTDLLITVSKSLIGTPYVWGGSSLVNGGFDCSGFTQYVFKQVGYTINRVSYQQATNGTYVPKDQLKPGDLIFFSLAGDNTISHVGIYLGNGQMIHSPKTGDTVKITDISTSYWQIRYLTARRIIQ